LAHDPVAPWAEPVLFTARDLATLPDDARRYELVEGKLVQMPPTGFEHGSLATKIISILDAFVRDRHLGRVVASETGFLLSQPGEPDTVLAPDAAFVAAARIPPPGSPDRQGFARLAPDLVVEIASPNQRQREMSAKARHWLAAGTRIVWIVWPSSQQVDVWRQKRDTPTTLSIGDEIDGEDVLPGFTCPLSVLFTAD
jgi:Uma2 family endonuclease